MLQHLIVTLIFVVCLFFVVRRTARIISRAKKGASQCDTCTEVSCPLRNASSKTKKCDCGCGCGTSK